MKTVKLSVKGMTCEDCTKTIKRALEGVDGVQTANVSLKKEEAEIALISDVPLETMIRTIEHAGYRASAADNTLLQMPDETLKPHLSNDSPVKEIAIIGSGSAGVAASITASELGIKTTLIESGTIGGTCVNVGCVPTKNLIRASEAYYHLFHYNFMGMNAKKPELHFSEVIKQKDELIHMLRKEKYTKVINSYKNIVYINDHAVLQKDDSKVVVKLSDRVMTFDKVILATGAHPWIPPIAGLDKVKYLTSTEALMLDHVPEKTVVIGGSAIGLELGQMFSRFGSKVIVLEALPRLMASEGMDISDAIKGYLSDEGIISYTSAKILNIEQVEDYTVTIEIDGRKEVIKADALVVATGRRANTFGIGLEQVGIQLGKKGEIKTNDYLQTSHPGIYAAGDVIGDPMFVYVAAYTGRLAVNNAVMGNNGIYDINPLPMVTFTDPQIASVGLNEDQANAGGIDSMVAKLDMKQVPRALAARDTRGFVKLIANKKTGKLIGAHIIAPEAGEMIMEPLLAIKYGITVDALANQLHPYLTSSEAIKLCAQTFRKDVSKLSCCA